MSSASKQKDSRGRKYDVDCNEHLINRPNILLTEVMMTMLYAMDPIEKLDC
jgi:hypothetical protein